MDSSGDGRFLLRLAHFLKMTRLATVSAFVSVGRTFSLAMTLGITAPPTTWTARGPLGVFGVRAAIGVVSGLAGTA